MERFTFGFVLAFLFIMLHLQAVAGQCNGTLVLDASAGFLSSDYTVIPPEPSQQLTQVIPDGPLNPYVPGRQCSWLIHNSKLVQGFPVDTVFLIWHSLDLGVGDTLTVYAGQPPTTTVLATYSSSNNGAIPATVISNQTYMYIVFQPASSSTQGAGFGAYFEAGACMYGIYELTRPSNTFGAGVAPDRLYENRQNSAFWIHSEDPAGLINLYYDAKVESGYDFLTFYDGPNADSPKVAITQADNTTGRLMSTASSMFVTWTSDKSTAVLNWQIQYNITTAFCSGTRVLSNSAGVFSDESSDADYRPGSDCQWLIKPAVPVGLVDLFFTKFSLADGDFLYVYEGTDTNGILAATYTGSEIPKHVSYSGDALLVRLVTAPTSPGAPGFSAVYHSGSCIVTSDIGAAEGSSGWITDGSGNSTYQDFQDCFWLFTVDNLSDPPPTISFQFVQFDLEWSFDRVTVYDGDSVRSPVLFSYSGRVDTSSVFLGGRTTGAKMMVQFTSDFSVGFTGWNMTFQANLPVEDSSGPDIPLIVGLSVGLGGAALCFLCILLLIILVLLVVKLRMTNFPEVEEIRFELKEPNYAEVTWPKKKEKKKNNEEEKEAEKDSFDLSEKQIKVLDKFLLNGTVALAMAEVAQQQKLPQLKRAAESMVTVYHKHDKAIHLIENLILYELEASSEESMMMKETLGIRGYAAFARIVGVPYLWSLFAYPIADLDNRNTAKSGKKDAMRSDSFFSLDTNVEVGGDEDAEELAIRSLEIQVVLQKLLTHITSSMEEFPLYLRYLLYRIYVKVRARFPDQANFIMGNLIFHRFLCPPLALPVSYGLLKSTPHPSTLKSLILIARVFSNLGRGTQFADDEPALAPLNEFLEENKEKVQNYMHALCGMNQKPLSGDPPSSIVPGYALRPSREYLYSFILRHNDELDNKLREFPSYKIQNALRWLSYLIGDDNKSARTVTDLEDLSDTEGSEKLELLNKSKNIID